MKNASLVLAFLSGSLRDSSRPVTLSIDHETATVLEVLATIIPHNYGATISYSKTQHKEISRRPDRVRVGRGVYLFAVGSSPGCNE